mgnify:CR=1 FL=1
MPESKPMKWSEVRTRFKLLIDHSDMDMPLANEMYDLLADLDAAAPAMKTQERAFDGLLRVGQMICDEDSDERALGKRIAVAMATALAKDEDIIRTSNFKRGEADGIFGEP